MAVEGNLVPYTFRRGGKGRRPARSLRPSVVPVAGSNPQPTRSGGRAAGSAAIWGRWADGLFRGGSLQF